MAWNFHMKCGLRQQNFIRNILTDLNAKSEVSGFLRWPLRNCLIFFDFCFYVTTQLLVYYSINCFSFIFLYVIISTFYEKNLIKTKYFCYCFNWCFVAKCETYFCRSEKKNSIEISISKLTNWEELSLPYWVTAVIPLHWYSGLVFSGSVLLHGLGGGASSGGVTIKMPYVVDVLLHWPTSHPIFSCWVA